MQRGRGQPPPVPEAGLSGLLAPDEEQGPCEARSGQVSLPTLSNVRYLSGQPGAVHEAALSLNCLHLPGGRGHNGQRWHYC